ncbi:MAG: hypothetical protein K0R39_3010 [Symbiobacteriaceae bacterium]|jgi:ribonuclease HI|nr:hypothetical protein [Symbiobacteriaceae bacterium]
MADGRKGGTAVTTSDDWLLVLPQADSWSEKAQKARQMVTADPVAAAIPEEEAAWFYVMADMLRYASREKQVRWIRRFGLRLDSPSEPNVRRGLRMVLRLWRQEPRRSQVIEWAKGISYPKYKNAAGRDFWTAERFTEALADEEIDITWICGVARELGVLTEAGAFLEAHGADGRIDEYRYCCDVGRLTMRKVVYPESEKRPAQQEETAAAVQAAAEALTDLAEKERKTSALRQDVRRLERDRKLLKEQNRRLTQEQKAEVSQARGEVAAAERELREFQAAHRAALAEQERRFQAEMAAIAKQIREAREEYALTLREQRVVPLLAGRTVRVVGAEGDLTAPRAQVETLGALLAGAPGPGAAPGDEPTATVDASGGLAALERQLRSLALGEIHIKCDGNWRKKMGRFGISSAAFEVLQGGRSIYQEGRPVSCGPLTSPVMSEYAAIIMALNWVARARPAARSRILIWSDCKYLVDHINGTTSLERQRGCATLDRHLLRLLRRVERMGYPVTLTWVPRANVHAMDRLCAATYYRTTWYHRREKGAKWPTLPLEQFLREACK